MGDEAEEPQSEGTQAEPPKIRAEKNAWYLLATLYGADDELTNKNRIAWNRYFASSLCQETIAKLIKEKRYDARELKPFLPEEQEKLQVVREAFAKRCRVSPRVIELPESNHPFDFKDIEFKETTSFSGYLLRVAN